MKKNVLILQNILPHYRRPVYNGLGRSYNLTVVHSGESSSHNGDTFRELVVPKKRVGPFFSQRGIFSLLKRERFDVVIAMLDIRWTWSLFVLLFRTRFRLIYWGHGYGSSRLANFVRDVMVKHADGVVLYSEATVTTMLKRGVPEKKIWVAENTVEVLNRENTSSATKRTFLFVGRAQLRKRIDLFIEAFGRAIGDIPEYVTVDIVGDGRENDRLRELVENLGLTQRVLFHPGTKDDQRLKGYFEKAYAYVSPGHVGLGALHSMAYGVPVVTCKRGPHAPEFNNLIDGVNAVVCDRFEDLPGALARIARDPPFSRALGENAYTHYSRSRTMATMLAGFEGAIENRRRNNETRLD